MAKKIVSATEKNILKFSNDTKKFGGYEYTSNEKLSSQVANEYQTQNTLGLVKIKGKSVADIGCGDGTYTFELLNRGKPRSIVGFDPSKEGILRAKKKFGKNNRITFMVGSIYDMPLKHKYDIAVVRGVLHHLYNPERAFPELKRVAKKVILIEPNGYNMILKVIEKTSKYHLDHEEKSYFPNQINKWVHQIGGKIIKKSYRGLVPFFSPDWFVPILKFVEPIIERLPVVNRLVCANYYVVYENK